MVRPMTDEELKKRLDGIRVDVQFVGFLVLGVFAVLMFLIITGRYLGR